MAMVLARFVVVAAGVASYRGAAELPRGGHLGDTVNDVGNMVRFDGLPDLCRPCRQNADYRRSHTWSVQSAGSDKVW